MVGTFTRCRTRFFSPAAIVLVFQGWAASGGTAEASCALARTFSTKNPAYGAHYIYTPGHPFSGTQPISNYALGFFWSLNGADKTLYAGNDDGTKFGSPFPAVYGGQSAEDWWDATGPYSFIGSGTTPQDGFHNWSNAGVDGCIDLDGTSGALDGDECMFVLLGDDPDGSTGFFAILSDSPRAGNYEFNEPLGVGEQILMAPVPPPQIMFKNRTSRTDLTVRVSVPEPVGRVQGLYDETCSQFPSNKTWPQGYKIYSQKRAQGGGGPDYPVGRNVAVNWPSRPDAPWIASGAGTTGFDAEATLIQTGCDPTSGGGDHIFICGILAFEGGYDTPYCSSDLVIECGGDPLAGVDSADGASIAGVSVQFSEAIDTGTVNSGTITLSVPYSVAATNATTATITPSPLLDFNTNYTVTVTNGVTDPETNQVAPESILIRTENRPGGLDHLMIDKSGATDIKLKWGSGSCEPDDGEFGIYAGTIAGLHTGYDHSHVICNSSSGAPFEETFLPPAGVDTYYIVVPQASTVEGSYGLDRIVAHRSQTTDCVEGNSHCTCDTPGNPSTCFCDVGFIGDGVNCSDAVTETERPVGTGCSKPQDLGGCRP